MQWCIPPPPQKKKPFHPEKVKVKILCVCVCVAGGGGEGWWWWFRLAFSPKGRFICVVVTILPPPPPSNWGVVPGLLTCMPDYTFPLRKNKLESYGQDTPDVYPVETGFVSPKIARTPLGGHWSPLTTPAWLQLLTPILLQLIPLSPIVPFPRGMLIQSIPMQGSVSTLKEISRIPGDPDSFQVISGKWKIPGKSGKLKILENLRKYVENITFMVWKSNFFFF